MKKLKLKNWVTGKILFEYESEIQPTIKDAVLEAIKSSADLSYAKNLLSPTDWINENLKRNKNGYVAYKTFGQNYKPPERWEIKKGAVISEVVNSCAVSDCACGVNVGTLDWVKGNSCGMDIWQVLIRWEWCAGITVPYNTDGKFRCERVELVKII